MPSFVKKSHHSALNRANSKNASEKKVSIKFAFAVSSIYQKSIARVYRLPPPPPIRSVCRDESSSCYFLIDAFLLVASHIIYLICFVYSYSFVVQYVEHTKIKFKTKRMLLCIAHFTYKIHTWQGMCCTYMNQFIAIFAWKWFKVVYRLLEITIRIGILILLFILVP